MLEFYSRIDLYTDIDCYIGDVYITPVEYINSSDICTLGINVCKDPLVAYSKMYEMVEEEGSAIYLYFINNNKIYYISNEDYDEFYKALYICGFVVVLQNILYKGKTDIFSAFKDLVWRVIGKSALSELYPTVDSYLYKAGLKINNVSELIKYTGKIDDMTASIVTCHRGYPGEVLDIDDRLSNDIESFVSDIRNCLCEEYKLCSGDYHVYVVFSYEDKRYKLYTDVDMDKMDEEFYMSVARIIINFLSTI